MYDVFVNKVHHNGFRVMVQGIFNRLHIIDTIPNKINFERLTCLPQQYEEYFV